jgi:hypothetical protein
MELVRQPSTHHSTYLPLLAGKAGRQTPDGVFTKPAPIALSRKETSPTARNITIFAPNRQAFMFSICSVYVQYLFSQSLNKQRTDSGQTADRKRAGRGMEN